MEGTPDGRTDMPQDTISMFYLRLLHDPELDSGIQRRVLAYGQTQRNVKLLTELAQHPSLDRSIEATLGTLPHGPVLAAWVARPGRSREDVKVLVTKEKRIGVLEALAGLDSLDDDHYQLLADKPNPKVAAVLVVNPAVPLDVKKQAAATWGKLNTTRGWQARRRALEAFTALPELHDAVASQSRQLDVFELVAASELSPATMQHVVTVLGDVLGGQNDGGFRQAPGAALRIIGQLGSSPWLGDAERGQLLSVVARYEQDSASSWEVAGCDTATRALTLGSTRTRGKRGANLIRDARESNDCDVLDKLAATATTSSDQALALALAGNRHSTTGQVDIVLDLLPRNSRGLLDLRREDTDVFATLAARVPWAVDDRLLGRCSDPTGTLVAVARKVRETGGRMPANLLQSRFLTPSVLLELPLEQLVSPDLPTEVSRLAAGELERRFGDDDVRWSVFESLGRDFTGSISELLDTCGLVGDVGES
jgi:hypothetical protein